VITGSTAQTQAVNQGPAWKTLAEHYQSIRMLHLKQLFAEDSSRGERYDLFNYNIYALCGDGDLMEGISS